MHNETEAGALRRQPNPVVTLSASISITELLVHGEESIWPEQEAIN